MLLDSSIFSRALPALGFSKLGKYLNTEESEIVVGRLTSMTGEIIKFSRIKPVSARNVLDSGQVIEIIDKEKKGVIRVRVAAGAIFKEVIEASSKYSLYPAIFPIYLEGTVGGFIATNGSGFGSYKFGFVNYSKQVHVLQDKDNAIMSFVNYPEVLETTNDVPYSWSALVIDNKVLYYVPSFYKNVLGLSSYSIQETRNVISLVTNRVYKIIKSGKVPLSLRVPQEKLDVIKELNLDLDIGYLIKYNSPGLYHVYFSAIDYDELRNIFKFLKKHPYVYPYPSLKEYSEIHKYIINNFDRYKVEIHEKTSEIRDIYSEALKCINCGMCLETCLAYNSTRNVLNSPVGRFNRLLKDDKNFEYCFGCMNCEAICPVGIKISKSMENLPRLSPNNDLRISVENLPFALKNETEKVLNSAYKNQPLVLLFIGCAYKYDKNGVENFLKFVTNSGDKIKGYPIRFKIIDGACCGFDSYISGRIKEAEERVKDIRKTKEESGAVYVYFFCPEALYVYNLLSGDKGILVYDVIKDLVNGKVHAGCWARKLGINGDNSECAGLFMTNYLGKMLYVQRREDILTICPFSTWKFGSISVYSSLVPIETTKTTTLKTTKDLEERIINISIQAYREAVLSSVDAIAEKVIMWNIGGKGYFALLAIPILRRNFSQRIKSLILDNLTKEEVSQYLSSENTLKEISSKIYEALKTMDYNDLVNELVRGIKNSKKLEYSARGVVENKEFLDVTRDEIIKKAISYNLVLDSIRVIIQY